MSWTDWPKVMKNEKGRLGVWWKKMVVVKIKTNVLGKNTYRSQVNDQHEWKKRQQKLSWDREILRPADRQTGWEVSGLISNAGCPALALQPSCNTKCVWEKKNLGGWKSSIGLSIIHWWIRSCMNEVEETRKWAEKIRKGKVGVRLVNKIYQIL